MLHAHHLHGPGQPRRRAADGHDGQDDGRHRETRIGRRPAAGAGGSHREAEGGAPKQKRDRHRDGGRDQNPDGDLGRWQQLRQPGGAWQQGGLREAGAGLAQARMQGLADHQQGDEVHEERDQHLMHAAGEMQNGGKDGPDEAAGRAGQEREHYRKHRVVDRECQGLPARRQATERDLALAADIDDIGAEAQSDAGAAQQIGGRFDKADGNLVDGPESARDGRGAGGDRVGAGHQDQQARDPE